MYAFESSGSRRPLHAMVVGSLIGAAVLFSISTIQGIPVPYLFQLGAVACLTATIYLVGKYSLKIYRYAIEPNTIVDAEGMEQYDLVITEIVGKKMKVVCRVGLRTVDHYRVTVFTRGETDEYERGLLCARKKVFRYENTPISPASCYIPIPEENAVVVIPADETMVGILKRE